MLRHPLFSESRFCGAGLPHHRHLRRSWPRMNLVCSILALESTAWWTRDDSQRLTWMCRPTSILVVKRTWRGLVSESASDPKRTRPVHGKALSPGRNSVKAYVTILPLWQGLKMAEKISLNLSFEGGYWWVHGGALVLFRFSL